jgi:hypothetical protein
MNSMKLMFTVVAYGVMVLLVSGYQPAEANPIIQVCCRQATGLGACETWCENEKECSFCSESSRCGPAYTPIDGASFEENGKTLYGCKKFGSINQVWRGTGVARAEHRALVVAVGGTSGSIRDEGMEWFCENYFKGQNKVPQVLCISSYARTATRSRTLSDNIADLANEIHRLSGVSPKITLIGKSMGGCKLHHAAAGVKGGKYGALKDMEIDLFIGVDPSCGLKKHFEEGLDDALSFQDNVIKILNFYQEIDSSQTGHMLHFDGEEFDDTAHIDVNNDTFDLETESKRAGDPGSLCDNVDHGSIDDCEDLKRTIRQLILKRAGLPY